MYDHLDGDVAVPGNDVREAVHHRASVLRRRRWMVAGSAGTSVALAGVLLFVNLTGASPRKATLVLNDPTPTTTASAEPTPDPTDEPRPTLAPSPSPDVSPVRTEHPAEGASATPSETCIEPGPDTSRCRDGKPGWSVGIFGCKDVVAADVPPARASDELFDGVTVMFVLPRGQVEAGKALPGVLRFHSTRQDRVSFGLGFAGGAAIFGAGRGGARLFGDHQIAIQFVDLEPGETETLGLGVLAASCGDGEGDPDLPLPAGDYSAGRTLGFIKGRTVADASPNPSAASPEATTTESAAPTVTDSPVPESGRFAVRLDVTVV